MGRGVPFTTSSFLACVVDTSLQASTCRGIDTSSHPVSSYETSFVSHGILCSSSVDPFGDPRHERRVGKVSSPFLSFRSATSSSHHRSRHVDAPPLPIRTLSLVSWVRKGRGWGWVTFPLEGRNPPVGGDRSRCLSKEGPSSEGRFEPEGSERKEGPYRRGHGNPLSPEERGAYVDGSSDRCREERRGGMEPSPSETGRMPPFRAGGKRGSSAHFVPSYRQNQPYTPLRCTPYPNTQRKTTDPFVRSEALPLASSHILLPLISNTSPRKMDLRRLVRGALWCTRLGGLLDQMKREPHIVT